MLENQIKNAIALSDPNALRSVLVKAENSELSEGWLPWRVMGVKGQKGPLDSVD